MDEGRLSDLPEYWVWTKLENISEIIMGQSPPSSTYNEQGIGLPFYQGKAEFGELYPTPVKWCSEPKKIAEKNDILISVRAPVGPTNICPEKSCIGRGLAAIRAIRPIDFMFILYYLRSFEEQIASKGTGSTFEAISKRDLEELEIPLPPLPEQRILVTRVESLLERVKKAKQELDKIPEIIKKFRQSVLKQAMSGRLTADWRERHPDVEPASEVLKRIQEERLRRYEEEVKRAKAEGRKKPRKPKNLDVKPLDASELPEVPDGWVWCNLPSITENHDGRRIPIKASERKKMQGKYPYYGASGIIDYVNRYIFDGDYLLISEDGANLIYRSTPIAFCVSGKFWVNNHAHVLSTEIGLPLKYLEHYFNSIDLSPFITGSAQPKLTQANLDRIPIPLPPLEEQKEIVHRIETLFKFADEVEKQVKEAQKQVEKISQSILAKAFRGELTADFRYAVKNWGNLSIEERRRYLIALPEDEREKVLYSDEFPIEPASVLLERIKAERERQKKERRKKESRRSKKKKSGQTTLFEIQN